MAFTEADRVQIRRYLCYPNVFVQSDPRLESAITTVQSTADGGSRPDNSAELDLKTIVVDLQAVDAKLKALWGPALATRADDVSLDVPRARAMLCAEGRRLVNALSAAVNTKPLRDYFSAAPLSDGFHAATHASHFAGFEA
jgi:hypothetical protein